MQNVVFVFLFIIVGWNYDQASWDWLHYCVFQLRWNFRRPTQTCHMSSSMTRRRPVYRYYRLVSMGTWVSLGVFWRLAATPTFVTTGAARVCIWQRREGMWTSAASCTSLAQICWPPTIRATLHCICVDMWTPFSSWCPMVSKLIFGKMCQYIYLEN